MFAKASSLLLVSCVSLLWIQSALALPIYDAQASFAAEQPTPTIPVGQFTPGRFTGSSVGAGPVLTPGTFVPFDTFTESLGGTVLDGFTDSGLGGDPNILYNDSGVTETMFALNIVPGQIALSPSSGPVTLRFTAPVAGEYLISASYTDTTQSANSDGQAFVLINGVQVFTDVADALASYSSIGTVTLGIGGTVDFVLAGDTLGFGNKTTGLTATLTFVPPVPEPSALSLLSLGMIGLLLRRRQA